MQRKIQIYKEKEKGLQVILKKRIAEREYDTSCKGGRQGGREVLTHKSVFFKSSSPLHQANQQWLDRKEETGR
jgi:hypothetical protein